MLYWQSTVYERVYKHKSIANFCIINSQFWTQFASRLKMFGTVELFTYSGAVILSALLHGLCSQALFI